MDVISTLHDERISSINVLVEVGLAEYAELVRANLDNNEFQRKRVSSSKTVYSLLKADLRTGCVIPPIVLALNSELPPEDERVIDPELIFSNKDSLVILDGLQRTHTILDLLEEINLGPKDEADRVRDSKIRVEVYLGLNKLGILYRMLTLNTGQTPMSLRQQIEMLYSDYIGTEVEHVELLKESDGKYAKQSHQYVFKDVVEGFNAFLNRDELPFDRSGLLENIKSLEKLSKINRDTDLFESYLKALFSFVERVNELTEEKIITAEVLGDSATPFGKSALQVFKRAQAMSGLGAAVGKHIDRGILRDLEDAREKLLLVELEEPEMFLMEINKAMDWLKNNTSKIGNAQRNYFTFFFRDLLNDESDSYLDLDASAQSALRKYQDQNY